MKYLSSDIKYGDETIGVTGRQEHEPEVGWSDLELTEVTYKNIDITDLIHEFGLEIEIGNKLLKG